MTKYNSNQISVWPNDRNDYHKHLYGLTMAECNLLNHWEKEKARKILEAGGTPAVRSGRVVALHAEEAQAMGVTDDDVKRELRKAKTPKERYEIAVDAHETGFMDEADFKKEIDRLARNLGPEAADQVHADLMIERSIDDDNDLDTWNASFA